MSRRSGWFLEITLDSSTLRWWSGELDITFDSETYTGLGTRWITPEEIKRSASLKSEKIELQFDSSRQTDNTDAIGALLDAKWRRRAVRLRRIAWDWGDTPDDGDVLVDEYGRIQNVSDVIAKDEQPTLSMEIESGSLAYLERRMVTRSSASQKAVFAGDKGFDLAVQLAGTSVAWRTKEKKEGTVKKTWPEGDPAPRHLIIGECVVEGSFVAHFANGQQNKYYQTIYAIADHKLTELNGIYMNGELVYNGVLSHGVKTEVTKWRSGGARCWVTYYDGRDDQTADSYLVSAETNWTTDHRLRGLAYCIIEHLYDDDNPLDYNYGFRVKGAALYDRRLDTTAGGSGSQRWNDPDTWTYTANAMVAIDHYRMGRIVVSGSDQMWFGIGEAADNIPYAEFEELADLCDEDVTLSGGGTHKRYEVNGQIPSDKSHKDVFEMLAAQMAAEAIDQGGRLSIRPPVTRSSVITLTDDDLLYESESEANPGGRIDDMVNTLVGKFRDAQNDYKFNEYPKVTNSTYVEDDNGEISDSFDLDLETDAERAQRLATLKIGLSRRIFELEETYIAKARVIAPGEWFTRTSASRGFTGKLFIADEVIRHFDGSVTVRSVEVDPDDLVWDENNAASIDAPPAFPSISLPGLDAPTVSVTAFEESGNGAAYPAFLFEFTQPADLTDILADYYEVEYGVSASGGGIDGTAKRQLIDAQIDAIEAVGFLPSTEYAFRFRARLGSRIGDWGSWIYETSTANSTSTDAGEVSWSNVTDDGGKPDDNADVTSANVASGFTGQTDWATDDTPVEALTRPAPNLIPDAGFRFGGKGWTLSAGATTSLTDAGGVLSHALSDGTRVSTVDVQGIEAGASYTLSAEFAAAYTSGSVYCDVIWLNDALATVLDDGGVIATKNAVYTGPKHATLTAPTGATIARVRFVTGVMVGATRLDMRRIKLAKCAYQTPWSDEATRTAAYGDDTNIDDLQPSEAGSDVTGANVASGFTGQGALATEDTLAYGSGFLTNFGTMAGNNFASFGVNVRLEDGTTVVTDNAVVTSSGVASGFSGQTAWATFSASTDRVQYLSDAGLLDSLSRISTRPLSLLSGRTADYITYTGGATVDSLEPAEAGSDVTGSNVSSGFSGQGALATEDDLTLGGGYLLGFGDLAANDYARFGLDVRLEDGTTLATDSAVVTASGVASGIAGQTAWATYSGSTDRVQYLSDTGLLDSLARITTRNLSQLNNRTADYISYTGGSTVESLEPQEAGANVTEDRVASGFTGQGALATEDTVGLDSGFVSGLLPVTSAADGLVNASIQLGGVNMLTKANWSAGNYAGGASFVTSGVANGRSGWGIQLVRSAGSTPVASSVLKAWPSGEDLTLSFIAWTLSAGATLIADLFPDTLPQQSFSVSTTPTLFKWEGLSSSHADMASARSRFFNPSGGDETIIITDIKWERGNKATFWSPAPEDVEALRLAGYTGDLAADVTSENNSAGFAGQTAWATYSGSTDRVQYLSDTGLLDSLTRISSRPLSALSGRTADQITYTSAGATVDSLEPQETGANVTEDRVASAFSGQGALATEDDLTLGGGYLLGFGDLAANNFARFGLDVRLEDGSTLATDSALVTASGVASGIAGQGAGATADTLAELNASDGSKLAGIQTGATVGADWSSNVSNRPVEVTDGRISAGLASNGDINRPLPSAIRISSNIMGHSGGGTFTGDLTADVTGDNIAAGFTGQTDWATEATPVEALTQPAPNLIPDAGFRFGAKGWTLTAGATTTLSDEGGLLSHPLSDGTRVSQVDIDGIAAGAAYVLSAEFAATYSTGTVYCDVIWLDGASATVLDDGGITATKNAVFAGPKYTTLTAPTGAEKARVRFVTASMTGATRLDVRRIKLAKSSNVSPFSDEATRTAAYGDDTNIDDLQPSEAGSDVTGANVASGFTGQGALATEDDIALDSGFLTGLLPTNRAASGLVNTNISIASNGSLSGGGGGQVTFGGLGGGDVGVLDTISLGSTYLRREDGTTQLTDNLVVTSVGTASGFSGQGALATLNALAYGDAELTGFGSLATLTQIALGSTYIKREDGTTTVTDSLVITTLGVSSGFSGQGDLATANMTYGGSAPSSPSNGDFWADTAEGALKFRNAGTWETIADISPTGSFSASYSGDPVNDAGTATDFTTSSISINVSGGTGPYLYLTEIISANVLVPKTSVTLPNSSSFQLSAEGFSVSENEKGIIRTTVVDETTGNSATIIKPWSMTRTS